MLKTSELRTKPVIELKEGRRLGSINDIEFDLTTGKVTGIVVPTAEKHWGFFERGSSVVIPWEAIVKIGSDVILVDGRKMQPSTVLEN